MDRPSQDADIEVQVVPAMPLLRRVCQSHSAGPSPHRRRRSLLDLCLRPHPSLFEPKAPKRQSEMNFFKVGNPVVLPCYSKQIHTYHVLLRTEYVRTKHATRRVLLVVQACTHQTTSSDARRCVTAAISHPSTPFSNHHRCQTSQILQSCRTPQHLQRACLVYCLLA